MKAYRVPRVLCCRYSSKVGTVVFHPSVTSIWNGVCCATKYVQHALRLPQVSISWLLPSTLVLFCPRCKRPNQSNLLALAVLSLALVLENECIAHKAIRTNKSLARTQ